MPLNNMFTSDGLTISDNRSI